MLGERDSHSREIARLREENRAARHEVVVANQILADERQKAVANEREIERLRGLDLQLEALQQNFANYAGAKQAQKEAHNEEESALQACVELIGQDVFALPFDEEQGEEEVELLLRRLKDSEESMAAEERTRVEPACGAHRSSSLRKARTALLNASGRSAHDLCPAPSMSDRSAWGRPSASRSA